MGWNTKRLSSWRFHHGSVRRSRSSVLNYNWSFSWRTGCSVRSIRQGWSNCSVRRFGSYSWHTILSRRLSDHANFRSHASSFRAEPFNGGVARSGRFHIPNKPGGRRFRRSPNGRSSPSCRGIGAAYTDGGFWSTECSYFPSQVLRTMRCSDSGWGHDLSSLQRSAALVSARELIRRS